MLGKVLKYEYKSTARMVLPFFALVLAMSGVMRLALSIVNAVNTSFWEVIFSLCAFLYMISLLCMLVITGSAMVLRFWQSLTGNEAYLTFTLPVKPSTHLLGRIITSLSYMVGGVFTTIASLFIFFYGTGISKYLGEDWDRVFLYNVGDYQHSLLLRDIPTVITGTFIALIAGMMLVTILLQFMQVFTAISIGTRFPKSRLISSVIAYFVINSVTGVIMLIVEAIPAVIYIVAKGGLESFVSWIFSMEMMQQLSTVYQLLFALMGIAIAVCLLFSAIHFFVIRHIITKKLNIE